jgi:hypothetical protein
MAQQHIKPVETDELPVGHYGERWLEFMQGHYPKLYRELKRKGTLRKVARSVHISAWDYKQLLDRQYDEYHFAPLFFSSEEEERSWKFTRDFYTDGAVMRERVLVPRREP